MKTVHLAAVAATALLAAACSTGRGDSDMQSSMMADSSSSGTVMVGGEAMLPSQTIVDNAVNSEDHTTLVAAVKAAGLVETLQSPGPFTVFAPTNAAFEKLPAGTVDTLLMPQNKAQLTNVLTYHVVPGRIDAHELMRRIEEGGGTATLTTASGGTLTAMMNGPRNIVIHDSSGGAAQISVYDVYQSNGVIHVVNDVLLPSA